MLPQMDSVERIEHELLEGDECVAAIVHEFLGVAGRLDARKLWECNGVSYYRVNWWRLLPKEPQQHIWRSAFVAVEWDENGPHVRELTTRRAA